MPGGERQPVDVAAPALMAEPRVMRPVAIMPAANALVMAPVGRMRAVAAVAHQRIMRAPAIMAHLPAMRGILRMADRGGMPDPDNRLVGNDGGRRGQERIALHRG